MLSVPDHLVGRSAADLQRYGPLETIRQPVDLRTARKYCAQLVRGFFPNFTLFRLVVPYRLQQHLSNIFAFWKWGKDLSLHVQDRRSGLALLDWWHRSLQDCYAGVAVHPVFVALRETIEVFTIPRDPFADLLAGFRQDQQVRRYYSVEELLAYCRYSCNPLGRLVLYVGECSHPAFFRIVDDLCTGAAWVSFCFNLARNVRSQRILVPLARAARYGYTEEDFLAERYNEPFCLFLQGELAEAEGWLRAGLDGVDRLPRWIQLAAGILVCEALELIQRLRAHKYNVWTISPPQRRWREWYIAGKVWWLCRRGRLRSLLP